MITGANRGIGQEMARQGRAAGHTVLGTTRGRAEGDMVSLDVTDAGQIAALAEALADRPLDLLVLNSGIYLDRAHALDTGFDADTWARTFAVNVTGAFQVAQAFLPRLRASGAGKIAIIASVLGSSTRPTGGGGYIYRASKAAAINMARNLSVDLAPQGIAVGVYHPGWVRTDMGGAAGEIDVATAAQGLWDRFDALSLPTTGCFESYDGTRLPF
jgi:NAD(P)-dependent dehydrogenase (short-subunit alcohol dehydrogenase family)